MIENPSQLQIDPKCVYESCQMRGTIALAVNFYLPHSNIPQTYFFNAALCEYHRWSIEVVEDFLDENWAQIAHGFGLPTMPLREKAEWRFVPWLKAYEFWKKLEAKKETIQ